MRVDAGSMQPGASHPGRRDSMSRLQSAARCSQAVGAVRRLATPLAVLSQLPSGITRRKGATNEEQCRREDLRRVKARERNRSDVAAIRQHAAPIAAAITRNERQPRYNPSVSVHMCTSAAACVRDAQAEDVCDGRAALVFVNEHRRPLAGTLCHAVSHTILAPR